MVTHVPVCPYRPESGYCQLGIIECNTDCSPGLRICRVVSKDQGAPPRQAVQDSAKAGGQFEAEVFSRISATRQKGLAG